MPCSFKFISPELDNLEVLTNTTRQCNRGTAFLEQEKADFYLGLCRERVYVALQVCSSRNASCFGAQESRCRLLLAAQ